MAPNNTDARLDERHAVSVPFTRFDYVDVAFEFADRDTSVEHDLLVTDPESVRYEVVRRDRACIIYDDQSAARRPWGSSFIVLRSSVAGATVRLRLFLEPDDNA